MRSRVLATAHRLSATAGRRVAAAALLAAAVLALPAAAAAAVDDPDSVDALQARPGKPFVYMVIVQDRDWSPETHVMIGNKIASYVRYAVGGQMVRDTPEAAGTPVRIVLVSATPPSDRDEEVLAVFREQVGAVGFDLVWGGEADLLDMVDDR
jgi:hypothetical protein